MVVEGGGGDLLLLVVLPVACCRGYLIKPLGMYFFFGGGGMIIANLNEISILWVDVLLSQIGRKKRKQHLNKVLSLQWLGSLNASAKSTGDVPMHRFQ